MFRGALATVVPCGARGVHAAWRVALRCRPRAPLSRRDPRRRRAPRGAAACGRDAFSRPAPAGRGVSWKLGNRVEGLFRRPVPRGPSLSRRKGDRGLRAWDFPRVHGRRAPCGRVRLPARPVLTREPEFQKYTRERRLFPRRCGVVRVGGEAAPWSPARPPWAPGRVRRGSPGARRVRLDDRPCAVREGCHPGGHGLGCTLGQHSQLCGPGGPPRVPGWSSRDTFQELEGLEQRSSYRRAPTSCSRTPTTGRDEAPMLTDAVRRSGGLAPRCWLWFPGKELGVPPARGARCL